MTPHLLHCIAAGLGVLGAWLMFVVFAYASSPADTKNDRMTSNAASVSILAILILALAAALGMA